jgi:hypothetical protein
MDIPTDIKTIQTFVDKGNFHAAINLSISAMNECRRDRDQAGVDQFLELIQSITNTMKDLYGSQAKE